MKDLRTQPPKEDRKCPVLLSCQQLEMFFQLSVHSTPSPGKMTLQKYYHDFPSNYYLKDGMKRIKYLELNLTKEVQKYTLKATKHC